MAGQQQDTSKINEILNYYGLKTNIEETKKWVKQYVSEALTGITTDLMTNVTYNELVSLRDNSQLKPGMLYRMTDYVTKVYDEDGEITSAEHPFDLILTAINENTLDENCRVALHEGDEYFSECKVEAWEVKYSLDNDIARFKYADIENGMGYICYMKDEWSNEAPFDFKNILQKDGEYTFGKYNEDYSLRGDLNGIYKNKILQIIDADGIQDINSIRISNKDCFSNIFKPTCVDVYIDFLISESDISMNESGELVIFKTADFITGIANKGICTKKECDYLTFEALEDGCRLGFAVYEPGEYSRVYPVIYYSFDKEHWKMFEMAGQWDPEFIDIPLGEKVYCRGINPNGITLYEDYADADTCNAFCGEGKFNVYGNIMSIINYEDTSVTLSGDSCFVGLFSNYIWWGVDIVDASGLKLPLLELTEGCYASLFYGCINLIAAPSELPATRLADGCYRNMFLNCRSLTTAPELPATALTNYCYESMFKDCTALETAPVLPATTLASCCYYEMFYNCKNLNYIKCLATNISAINCAYYWVYGVASAGTFVYNFSLDNAWSNVWNRGHSGIPNNWIPVRGTIDNYITITTLQPNSTVGLNRLNGNHTLYYSIDNGDSWNYLTTSTNITLYNTNDTVLIAGKLTDDADYENSTQFQINGGVSISGNVNSLWDFENLNTPLKQYCGYRLFYNCTGLIDASGLILGTSATTLADNCYECIFENCTSLTTVPNNMLPATTLANECYSGMFYNCSSLTTAPALPATTLAERCYYGMFNGCSSLTTAPELPATALSHMCYSHMFESCTSLTTAPELLAMDAGLYDDVYYGMFRNCTNLHYLKIAAQNISAGSIDMILYGAAETGTLVKSRFVNESTMYDYQYAFGEDNIPPGWTIVDDDDIPYNYVVFESNIELSYIGFANIDLTKHIIFFSNDEGKNWFKWPHNEYKMPLYGCQKLYLCGQYHTWEGTNFHTKFDITGDVSISGNINGVWDAFQGVFAFAYLAEDLFMNCEGLTDASGLKFPRYTALSCYSYMFYNCTNLTKAPEILPATTLKMDCYKGMFSYCSSLTTAPVLPATTLANECYYGMFQRCTSLTTAPALPATTLAENCYAGMFNGCSNLNYIKCLATDISASICTYNWVNGVANSGTFIKHPDMQSWTTGINGIPTNWAVEDAVIE